MNIEELQNKIGSREMKFKVWDKFQKRFHEDGFDVLTLSLDGKVIVTQSCEDGDFGDSLDDDYVVCPYTGYKDKNGVEIYIGYILKEHIPEIKGIKDHIKDYNLDGMVISNAMYYGRQAEDKYHLVTHDLIGAYRYSDGWGLPDIESCEVVGNGFENPDLLSQIQ